MLKTPSSESGAIESSGAEQEMSKPEPLAYFSGSSGDARGRTCAVGQKHLQRPSNRVQCFAVF